jgi:hypothetical protein
MTKVPFLFAAALALGGAALLLQSPPKALAQAANPAPTQYAYGPAGTPIAPLYAGLTGSYAKTLSTGTMGAGLASAAPIYSFRYTGANFAVIKRVTMSAGNAGTGFAAGVATFNLFAARAFTASDSGGTAGTLTGNNGKLRTSFVTTGVGDIRIASTGTLTAGTRTLDTDPLGGVTVGVPVTANATLVAAGTTLIDPKNAGDYPLVLATNEGFVIQATVPATGTWSGSVFVEWDEYSAY